MLPLPQGSIGRFFSRFIPPKLSSNHFGEHTKQSNLSELCSPQLIMIITRKPKYDGSGRRSSKPIGRDPGSGDCAIRSVTVGRRIMILLYATCRRIADRRRRPTGPGHPGSSLRHRHRHAPGPAGPSATLPATGESSRRKDFPPGPPAAHPTATTSRGRRSPSRRGACGGHVERPGQLQERELRPLECRPGGFHLSTRAEERCPHQ